MLGVSANTLRSWEQRYGHPTPMRTEGGHRIFELTDIEALRHALSEVGDIASAISIVRERGDGPATPERLSFALAAYDELGSDRILEESLTVRSVERTVDEVLLRGVERLEAGTPERSFAWRYATGWLAASKRVAPPASRDEGVLIFDGSGDEDVSALHVQALELLLRRGGLRTLCVSASLPEQRIGNAVRALSPSVLLLAGSGSRAHGLGRLVHAARRAQPELKVCEYGAGPERVGASTVASIGQRPLEAAETLRALLSAATRERPALSLASAV